jgi:PAS domain S-box-containing protein
MDDAKILKKAQDTRGINIHKKNKRETGVKEREDSSAIRLDAILEAVNFAAERFLRASMSDRHIREVLEHLGRATGAKRAYIFSNTKGHADTLMSLRYEWTREGYPRLIGNLGLQNLSYHCTGLGGMIDLLSEGGTVQSTSCIFPSETEDNDEKPGSTAILIVPIFVDMSWWGFIGLEGINNAVWPDAEIKALRAAANIIGTAIHHTQIAKELQESQRDHQMVINSLYDFVFVLDMKGQILRVNESAVDRLGYTHEELLKRNFFDLHPQEFREKAKSSIVKVLTGKMDFCSVPLVAKNGDFVPVETKITLGCWQESDAMVAISRDVTEKKEAELKLAQYARDLKRSNEELEQFAYVASHDLQEPLRMVTNYLGLLERQYKGILDKNADEFIFYAVDGASRMQTLINDLLEYSRISTRAKPFAPTHCEEVFQRVSENLSLLREEHNGTITHDPLPVVYADESQLEKVFQNLIANGIKFHSTSPPTVHVSAQEIDGNWVFSVMDNGIGIDPQFFDRIFVIFQRLHGRSTYPGTGIGLAICKGVVERHGGTIWVESVPGEGSTFYFTLPTAHAQVVEK